MEFNWVHSLIYGLVCGYSQFLPVSSEAHRIVFLQLSGIADEGPGIRLAVHVSTLLALLIACWPQISKLRREQRFAAIPPKRRMRQPDKRSLLDMKLLRTAAIPLLLGFLAYPVTEKVIGNRFWLVAVILAINGLWLYWPQFMPGANKDSQTLSGLDALLIGLAGALAVIPGISRVGMLNSAGQMRGAQRRYMLDISFLLCIPASVVLIGFDIYGILFSGMGAITAASVFAHVAAAAVSFLSAYLGIFLLRSFVVRESFAGFAYYSWGLALFIFILYLTI